MGRKMGLDVGDKTIGVALSDLLGWTAQGLKTIFRKNKKEDFKELEEIINSNDVDTIVVGLPKNMNGTIGPQGEKVLEFCEELKIKFNIKVELWDERLSTVAAERSLISADVSRKKRKQVIDKMAAVYILQGFLDRKI
ncbi:Holliday junction resolvase RuvX [Serpentinicella alkaliphila]|uniref:Putative pre-16S rRNA nuclease n=1 Tax=Serpentinicella alkaliphila TaxID=1734049 RepID=A0A4R2TAZ8_9FIRM|nr:Holliday junction resolvase RuvX [Serpentinicella alkaliphila]QUH26682.1 Holliday junction resolvase RuvX [Serpentinicella alkaliphila]TCQ00520.1 putative Holliday junction resolvase [Serpentinicella alkaliphila]